MMVMMNTFSFQIVRLLEIQIADEDWLARLVLFEGQVLSLQRCD